MARLPTLQSAERAILDVFEMQGTLPGESINQIALALLMERGEFRAGDLNKAVQSMVTKDWVELKRDGWLTLTEAGYAEV